MIWLADALILLTAIYHILVGIPSVLSVKTVRNLGQKLYQIHIPESLDPRYEYALKPIGFYALFVAQICLASLLIGEPQFKRATLFALSLLFIGRAWARWYYKDLFSRAFQISWERSRWNIVFNIILTAATFAAAVFMS